MVLDWPTLIVVALGSMAAIGVYHVAFATMTARRRQRFHQNDVRDAANQLRFVMAADFARRRVMEPAEYRVFRIVEDEVVTLKGHRVFAQTSLGEVIRSGDWRAHSSINSKRVDILVIAPDGYPLLAVEYQGGGHYQGSAAARDAVKKEALRKAGVAHLEIARQQSPDEIRLAVRSALRCPSRSSPWRPVAGSVQEPLRRPHGH
jgi:hypothetical protein